MIRKTAYEALKSDFSSYKYQLPEHFSVKLEYKEHITAAEMQYFPGAYRIDSHTVGFEENDIFEVARKLKFML